VLVRLIGIEALELCFHSFSKDVLSEKWSFRALPDVLAERDGLEAATAALTTARARSPELDGLMGLIESDGPTSEGNEGGLDHAAIKERVAKNQGIPSAWIKSANARDLEWVADELLTESNERSIRAYLRVFTTRDFPGSLAKIFSFAKNDDWRIAYMAARVLRRVSHPELRSLALTLISEGKHPAIGVRLLRSNLLPDDFRIIEGLLAAAEGDEHEYHSLGLAILDLLSRDAPPPEESRTALIHLYENDPCSNCREYVVDNLIALGGVPSWIAEECRYDAVPAITACFCTA
jgi:hypothetical protein